MRQKSEPTHIGVIIPKVLENIANKAKQREKEKANESERKFAPNPV